MQYFVSAENTSYFYWQLELLIESFIMHGVQDQLVIGLAENENQKVRGFSSNLVKHKNKFLHENKGRKKEYLPYNQIEGITSAISLGAIKVPFVLIHADMVMKKPIVLSEEDEKYGIIINNFEEISSTEKEKVNKKIDQKIIELSKERNVEEKIIPRLPCVSPPIIFNDEESLYPFLSSINSNIKKTFEEEGKNFPVYRTALEMALVESFQHLTIKGSFMANTLLDDEDKDANFLHYKTGIPPVFNKRFYKYEGESIHYFGQNPHEMLLENNPTPNTNYIHKVIRSYNKKKNN